MSKTKEKIEKINSSFRCITDNENEVWGFSSKKDMLEALNKINEIIDYLNSEDRKK